MGARLYNPVTGRFLSMDSVAGGNDNTYTYPPDPINMFDLSGEWSWRKVGGHFKKHWKTYATVASFAVPGLGYAGAAYRGYKAAKLLKAVHASRGSTWATKSVSRGVANRAGRKWTKGQRTSFSAQNGAKGTFSRNTGNQYRADSTGRRNTGWV